MSTAGLPPRTVQRAEKGQRRINLGEAAAIAQALGRSLDELVNVSETATFEAPTMGRPRRATRSWARAGWQRAAIDLALVVRDSPP